MSDRTEWFLTSLLSPCVSAFAAFPFLGLGVLIAREPDFYFNHTFAFLYALVGLAVTLGGVVVTLYCAALYAQDKRRSKAWGLLALVPVLGLVGLWMVRDYGARSPFE